MDHTEICVNLSETGNCTLHFNGTDYVNSSVASNVCWARTGITDGNYSSINATCEDLVGNPANTTEAWLYVDASAPVLQWDWNYNRSSTSSSVNIRVLSSEDLISCVLSISDSNHTMTSLTSTSFHYAWDRISNGKYYLRAYCNDMLNNTGTTSRVWYKKTSPPQPDPPSEDHSYTWDGSGATIGPDIKIPGYPSIDFEGNPVIGGEIEVIVEDSDGSLASGSLEVIRPDGTEEYLPLINGMVALDFDQEGKWLLTYTDANGKTTITEISVGGALDADNKPEVKVEFIPEPEERLPEEGIIVTQAQENMDVIYVIVALFVVLFVVLAITLRGGKAKWYH